MMPERIDLALAAAHELGLDRLDAQWLLLHVLGKPVSDRAWLLAHDSDSLAFDTATAFHQLCQRRAAGEPLAYLVGYREFFGLVLKVDSRVLVPRPDTETLVQWVLDVLQTQATAVRQVLDLGTGSGAIALAIAKMVSQRGAHPSTTAILAVDASSDALVVAQGNAQALGLADQVEFLQSNWFENVSTRHHVIASNPPYIASDDAHLPALAWEPLQALTAGADGLDDLRRIIAAAPEHLHTGGWLLLEHGFDQADEVCMLLTRRGFGMVSSRLDLAGHPRCSGGRWEIKKIPG